MTRGIASKERLFLCVIAPPRSRTTSLVRHLSFLFARMEFLLGTGGPGRGGPGAGPPGGFSIERLFRFDRNNDGGISRSELPEFLAERLLGRADTNQDGVIDKEEAKRFGKQLPANGSGGQERRGPNGGSQ